MKQNKYFKLGLDIIMTISIILLMVPRSLGQTIHEWAGLVLAAVFLYHILLNWKWVQKVSLRFLRKLPGKTRLNYILTLLMFTGFLFIIISGLYTAKTIDFSWLGLTGGNQGTWKVIHSTVSYMTFMIVGIHTGLNFRWVVNTVKKAVRVA